MTKVLVIVPLPLGAEAVERRRRQLQHVKLGPDIKFDFRPVKAGRSISWAGTMKSSSNFRSLKLA